MTIPAPSLLESLSSQAAAGLLSRMLARESWARDKLMPFAGRCARLELPPLSVMLSVTADGRVQAAPAGTAPNVTLTADTAALPSLLADPKALLRNVRLQGDAEFAQALGFVLQNLKPEPAEELAPLLGDAAAERVVSVARAAFAQVLLAGERLSVTAADYFVAENPMIAARADVDAFVADVNHLRDAAERLDQRIAALERRLHPPA